MTLREKLDAVYAACNRRDLVHPDPIEFLYRYPRVDDREIAGLIAASLAYGRVAYILKSVGAVLDRLGDGPAMFLDATPARDLSKLFRGLQHRWTTADHLAELLAGIKRARAEHGSLRASFAAGFKPDHETIEPALADWVHRLRGGPLLPDPAKGSACKRLHLFLRWMVRRDEVDPGGWEGIAPATLIVPLDVHMHRVARLLRLTGRRQANRAAALDVTAAFRRLCPDDPVRYDFALTRFGIREGLDEGDVRAEVRSWGKLNR